MINQIKLKLINITFLLISFLSYSQQTFKGVVVEDDTETPVANAIVAIENTALAKNTNNNGEFQFAANMPLGEHVVTVTKQNYDTKYFLIEIVKNKTLNMSQIRFSVNKKERKRREKEIKEQLKNAKKAEKENQKKLKNAQKEKEKEEKELNKKKKKLKKDKKKNKGEEEEEPLVYEETTVVENAIDKSLQEKYAQLLNTDPNNITNNTLYTFLETWIGTKYLLGGETKEGIDCSSFTQRFYIKVYDMYIERTAEKQFKSKLTDKFQGKEYLQEGDLIFFKGSGENSNVISHVGIYLSNNKFIHATSYTRDTGSSGVKISDLSNAFWVQRFVAGGRRINH
ncbi:MAG: NlpC/P60 family protein [Oceanihabitans sp.]